MTANIPVLVILLPLCSALPCLALTKVNRHLGNAVVKIACLGSFVLSVIQLTEVVKNGPIHYAIGNYAVPYGIELVIDSLNAVLLVAFSLIGFLTLIFAGNFGDRKRPMMIAAANAEIALLITGLLGMTSTGDVFNLYVFLEITSLSAYCLISLGGSRGVVSAYRYMLVGTIAATFYLLGIGILYGATGTLNMGDMARILNEGGHDNAMLVAMCFLIPAFGIKMALFPFHGWQPSAYAHAEPGSRPLITGVMGKVPALAMFRFFFCIYGTDFRFVRLSLILLGVFSVIGMLYGSIMAMGQSDIRKILAYSSVAQIGYISLGFAIGTPVALAGAFLHMLGHAFMKGGLFFCTGAIRYKYGTADIDNFGRIYKKMPLTCGLLVIASLSMIGIPPTVGFFSKWYLALGAAGRHEWIYIAVLVISSLLNAVYFFKLIEKVFIRQSAGLKERWKSEEFELPVSIILPVVVCFLAILGLGLFNVRIIDILLMTLEGVGL
ncbi:MAG: monovalent cation/H+ antiporter subunit D family protein [Mogibacterium sp.]|nr:monovalent cation/H+ antiporter subunit D family protein [Mogibacterium sp.]